ncbi:hypothetical protein BH11PSE3_BH11PSE3_07780 [soil metagenome]
MTFSTEMTRFLADHATVESLAAFADGSGRTRTAADLAAAMKAQGYGVDEAEVSAALEYGKEIALTDRQLDGVVGGSAPTLPLLQNLGSPPPRPARDMIEPSLRVLVNLGYG